MLTPEEVGAWIGQYFRTIDKTRADIRYYAMRQIVSDVIDGARAVSSFSNSDGSGVSVTYDPSITGYVAEGGLIDSDVVIPELAMGSRPVISVEDTVAIADDLLNAVTEMHDQSTRYSKLGIDTSVPDTVKPFLVMESKVLNAMDSAVMSGAAQRLPTRTARDYIRTFADLVEIPSFAELPTNAAYADKRLGAVILARDAATEQIAWEDAKSQPCADDFGTGYVYGGESALSIWRGAPAAALLVDRTE